jgi:hypothetical protein
VPLRIFRTSLNLFASFSLLAAALVSAGHDTPKTPPSATASAAAKPPVLDGEVLNDPAWQLAQPITGFWQTNPDEGRPASQHTEVRILYTADTLYFGVVCFDKEPERIIVSDSRRDSPLDETDCFQIILDTYHDKQNGFVFSTNPAGIEYDAQVTNEGQGEGAVLRQQGGAVGGFNINWDGAWEVRAKISEIGWSAEFAIPFRTLRYKKGEAQTWGLNFQRNIRRRNETAFWAPLPRQFNLLRLSQAGTLQGLQLAAPRNLKFTPYVLSEAKFQEFDRLHRRQWQGDLGADVKYSLTPALTLDATYNTDFAQVEVDEQQINLDRFSLFFPEKRPFFLENAGLFTVGSPGEVEIFFSRRIGLDEGGRAIPIAGGGRISGKVGKSDVGLLNMQTEALGGVQANNFTVARFKQELPNRSNLGAIFVNRQGTGELAPEHDYNRTFGLDAKLGYGKSGQVSGFFARSFTPGRNSKQHAFKIGASYDVPALSLSANYTESAENFNPEVGFLQRRAFRKPDGLVLFRFRPKNFIGIQELRPHVSYRGYWDFDDFQVSGFLHVDNHWEWKSGYEIHTGVNFTREGVKAPFEIFPGIKVPSGTYDNRELMLVFITNQGAWWSLESRWTIGGYFSGDRVTVGNTAKMRLGEALNTEVGWTRNDINLREGDFVTNLIRWRLSYSFTPRLFLQALLQFNDRADLRSTNVRLGWLQSANTGLFIVYTETNGWDDADPLLPSDRRFTLKYSRLFDVLQ